MTRTIYWDPKGRKDLEALDGQMKRRIRSAIERLTGDNRGVRRLTASPHRSFVFA
jgi:hypothetical protein